MLCIQNDAPGLGQRLPIRIIDLFDTLHEQ